MRQIKLNWPLIVETLTQYNHWVWPIVFWGWVAAVSFWIESAQVIDPSEEASPGQFTKISFQQMQFEQRYAEGQILKMHAPSAMFHTDTRKMQIQKPQLVWNDTPNGQVFSASAAMGEISVRVNRSALPDEFNLITLSQGAQAHTKDVVVQAEQMQFDNLHKLAIIKGPFEITRAGTKGEIPQDRVFDPTTQNLYGTVEEALQARRNQPANGG